MDRSNPYMASILALATVFFMPAASFAKTPSGLQSKSGKTLIYQQLNIRTQFDIKVDITMNLSIVPKE